VIDGFCFRMKAAIKYYGLDSDGNSGHYSCIIPLNQNFYEISDDHITIYDSNDLLTLQDILVLFLEKY
jgi:hypothetical protein